MFHQSYRDTGYLATGHPMLEWRYFKLEAAGLACLPAKAEDVLHLCANTWGASTYHGIGGGRTAYFIIDHSRMIHEYT